MYVSGTFNKMRGNGFISFVFLGSPVQGRLSQTGRCREGTGAVAQADTLPTPASVFVFDPQYTII